MKLPDGIIIHYRDSGNHTDIQFDMDELICCHNCKFADGKHRRCTCPGGLTGELEELGYCYKAVKRENDRTRSNPDVGENN